MAMSKKIDAGVQKEDDGFPRKEILNGGPYTESVEIPWTVPRARSPIQADRYRP